MAQIYSSITFQYKDKVFYFNGDVDTDKYGEITKTYSGNRYYDVAWFDGTVSNKVPYYNLISEEDGFAIINDVGEYPTFDAPDDGLIVAKKDIKCVTKPVNANQYANTFSNYAYNHIDTAYKYDKTVGNIFDIYMITESEPQLDIKINVTTYADKIRINVFYTGTRNLIVSVILQPKKFTPEASEDNLHYLLSRIYGKLRKDGVID